jgi:hypothetical protein
MKKKLIMALTVVFAMCLAITVFAFNQTSLSSKHAADCCPAKKDSCPMKDKQAAADKASCCDQDDKCPMKTTGEKTDGKDSCPMNAVPQTAAATIDMTNVKVVSSEESCCKPGADCCKSDSCCKGKHS